MYPDYGSLGDPGERDFITSSGVGVWMEQEEKVVQRWPCHEKHNKTKPRGMCKENRIHDCNVMVCDNDTTTGGTAGLGDK